MSNEHVHPIFQTILDGIAESPDHINGSNNPADATSYWMLKPGTAKSTPMVMSSWQSEQCGNTGTMSFDAYQLAPNDQTVSGVPSAPITGPVTIG